MRSPSSCHRPALVVAESLQPLALPGQAPVMEAAAPSRAIAAAIARALIPPRAPDRPPDWLRPHQHESFARAVAALRWCGGALLSEPVGAGKTWIGLAVAACLEGRAVCLVPASLKEQWHRTAARCGVPVEVQTHEAWSRRTRPLPPGLVVIDESHRFRHRLTARYRHLARALVGRRALLLSATPIVNRAADLAHQLALAVPDDLFAPRGTASLGQAISVAAPPAALDHVVITTADPPGRPGTVERNLRPGRGERRRTAGLACQLDQLRLSTSPSIGALIRGVLLHALASSPAALREALCRYRHLLLQQQDALSQGHRVSRRSLRAALRGAWQQLVWWSLIPDDSADADLEPGDLPLLTRLIDRLDPARLARDPKAERLNRLLEDGRVSIVFAGARATVHHLRRNLVPPSRVAWCVGREAGIGSGRLHRRRVLAWFRPEAPAHADRFGPRVLITTDVASEGLDLHRASRIVHYDLPWTAVRLVQRTGRAARPGSSHGTVEVVRFDLPPVLERRLGVEAALIRKAALPRQFGLGAASEAWCWRRRCFTTTGSGIAARGACRIRGAELQTLAAVEIWSGPRLVSTQVLIRRSGRPWSENPGAVEAALQAAREAPRSWAISRGTLERELSSLHRHLRPLLLQTGAHRMGPTTDPAVRAAIVRLQQLARAAWRTRRRDHLEVVSRGMEFLQRGRTAGEQQIVAALGHADIPGLAMLLDGLPDTVPALAAPRLVLIGLVRLGPR